jgi:hypothetical protein
MRALTLGALLGAGCAAEGPEPAPEASGSPTAEADLPPAQATPPSLTARSDLGSAGGAPVTLRGWLSIVWNDQPHFFITKDNGETVEVLLDDLLTRPLGGPMALDRTRVVVLAVVTQESPQLFQALSIEREAEG